MQRISRANGMRSLIPRSANRYIDGAEATTPITEGKINGNEISFVENLKYQGMDLRIVYKGTISGDEIQLERVEGAGGEKFVAKRAK
jgi:hypothetical protein